MRRLSIAVLALLLPSSSQSLECVDYSRHALVTNTFFDPETVYDLRTSGSLGYALSYQTLDVYDFAPEGNPVLVGSEPHAIPIIGGSLTLGSDLAYIGSSVATPLNLYVVDLSDPLEPEPTATLFMPSAAKGTAESGPLVYVATDYAGLQIVDVSEPTMPTIIASAPTADRAEDVARLGDLAVVAARTELVVFDVSNPLAPSEVGSLSMPTDEWAWRVEPAGPQTAIVATFSSELNAGLLLVVDVSDPANPQQVGSVPLSGRPERLATDDIHAFVSHRGYGSPSLQIVDLQEPEAPVTLGVLDLGGWTMGVAMLDERNVVLSTQGITNATLDSVFRTVAIRDGTCTDALTLNGVAEALFHLEGNRLLSGAPSYTVNVRDASFESLPLIGSIVLPRHWNRGASQGDLAVVSARRRIYVLDVSDPVVPSLVSAIEDLPEVNWLGVHRDHVYATAVDYFETGESHHRIIDVTDPADPSVVFTTTAWGPFDFYGDFAYVGDTSLRVLDVSDPSSPLELPGVDVGDHFVRQVRVHGDQLGVVLAGTAISGPSYELRMFDLTEPSAPAQLGRVALPIAPSTSWPNGLDLAPGLAYVAGSGGLIVIDTEDPASPQVIGIVPSDGVGMQSAFATEEHVFVWRWTSSGSQSAGVLGHPCPASATRAPPPIAGAAQLLAYPNPFRTSTTVELDRPLGKGASVFVYDVTGRRVADLTSAVGPVGSAVRWDGTDGAGRTVAAGVYFLKLTGLEGARTQRLVRLR